MYMQRCSENVLRIKVYVQVARDADLVFSHIFRGLLISKTGYLMPVYMPPS